ncbi:hypothetical protein [Dongia sp.]|uniref:hypothetical protein n=1 Tax=Dongia sp. TaxID=1977262 RepID=UPI003751C1E3
MTQKNIPDQAQGKKASPGAPQKSRELDAKELDKVAGGRPSSIGNTKEPLAGG